jgi:hypothetical protein
MFSEMFRMFKRLGEGLEFSGPNQVLVYVKVRGKVKVVPQRLMDE